MDVERCHDSHPHVLLSYVPICSIEAVGADPCISDRSCAVTDCEERRAEEGRLILLIRNCCCRQNGRHTDSIVRVCVSICLCEHVVFLSSSPCDCGG